jgi:transposase
LGSHDETSEQAHSGQRGENGPRYPQSHPSSPFCEEKIRIVLEGLRGEDSIAELCRKEGINQNLYYRWSKEFLEAGKKRLAGDTAREATSDEVKELKCQLKETLAEVLIENRLLKKTYGAPRSQAVSTR